MFRNFLLLFSFQLVVSSCPPWTLPYDSAEDNTTQCRCGDGLGGVVDCNRDTLQVSVLYCYCMTYNTELNITVVGHCLEMCGRTGRRLGDLLNPMNASEIEAINSQVCGPFNRKGQLCGECAEGYGPPVYSYSTYCVKCDRSNIKYNLLKYIAVAFIPLTFLYLIVILSKFNATSSSMVACVMICQLATIPTLARHLLLKDHEGGNKYIIAFVGIWNLDIFRSIYPLICIHPDMTNLQVLALDYLVGVYPLVLIAITYIAVMFHDRYPLIVRLWRPVNKLCICISREWDVRGSLVQTFATFLVLSYVKILNVSFDLLTPVSLQTPEGEYLNQTYLYNAGETPYFGQEHLPYGVLAVVMLTVFNILPVILLFLYPCSCCHKCLNYCHLSSRALHIFMDTFQGCYHHKPKERRYFAALYLIARWMPSISFVYLNFPLFALPLCLYLTALAISISIFQPYKKMYQNTLDVTFFSASTICCFISVSFEYSRILMTNNDLFHIMMICIVIVLIAIGFLMISIAVLPKKVLEMVGRIIRRRMQASTSDDSLPHRFFQEHSPLIGTCS